MKHIILRLMLFTVIAALLILVVNTVGSEPAAISSCALPPSSLVSWWPGEGNGNDIADGNDGTVGTGTTFATGKVGQAFNFDGSTGHINIPDSDSGSSLDGFTQLTIEAWVNPDSIGWPDPESGGNISAIISKHDTTKTDGVSYSLLQFNGKLRFEVVQTLNPDRAVGLISNADIPIGAWSHVAAVWNGGTDLQLYLNGAVMPATFFSEGSTPTAAADNDVPVNIGRIESFSGTHVGPAAFFDGLIDEVTIYKRALSSITIHAIYNAGTSGKCDPNDVTKTYLPLAVKPPDIIYFDDFSNPASGWPIVDRQNDRLRYINNEYEIMLRRAVFGSAASAPVADINNYTVTVDARQHSGTNAGYGLIFERIDWLHFYLFLVFPDTQEYALYKYNQQWIPLISKTSAPAIKAGNQTNRLGVTRIGSQITMFINDVQVDSHSDGSYSGFSREVGLYAESANVAPVVARFDNFTVVQE